MKIRAPTTDPDDSGKLSFIDIKDDDLNLYHVADPREWHHAANRRYVENSIADSNFASKEDANTFKQTQTVQKSSYFQNTIIHNSKNADTLTEVRGDTKTEPSSSGTRYAPPHASVGYAIQDRKQRLQKMYGDGVDAESTLR